MPASQQELDLTPDPRVLQMLGEINLQQWRCLAELIDNSIDGFASDGPSDQPRLISVTLPMAASESARVTVRDNGPGMSIETLEHAVRAGWTGKSDLSQLGLFGMGFNIATARLGLMTEVWTTRRGDAEWVGIKIDLNDLRASRTFRVPRRSRAKVDPADHGTEIIITRLKPDQRSYLARAANQRSIRKQLAKTYATLLARTDSRRFQLEVNGVKIEPRRHCIWARSRSVELGNGMIVNAVETFDVELAPRRYCSTCMRVLESAETACVTGGPHCEIIETSRRVSGWVGLQRYLDDGDYGLDFVRNGRKIETASKDLFFWSDGESRELEYPIDDPRNRGRFVGEIHLDHCRVSYTKDRFERDDPAWDEMVGIVRGAGPLRPREAASLGYRDNFSPLYKLFQAFRRSSPQGKAGRWSRVLVVKANERARQMAEQFHDNEPEYLTDEPWWRLVEEQDREALQPPAPPTDPDGPTGAPEGFIDPEAEAAPPGGEDVTSEPEPEPAPEPDPVRVPLLELSRKYAHPTYRVEYDVQAYAVTEGDPGLPLGLPWVLELEDVATRTYAFLVNPSHDVFASTTMTILDALMVELSYRTVDFLRGQDAPLSGTLSEFRRAYCRDTRLDPGEIIATADKTLRDMASALAGRLSEGQGDALFAELNEEERATVMSRLAHQEVKSPSETIRQGLFWEHASDMLSGVMARHPELFFDGTYWADPYSALDFHSEELTERSRRRVVERYEGYLTDARWLATRTPRDIEAADRDAVIRATYSLRLLRPDLVE